MNHPPRVSIIIVGYQSRHHLGRCLGSVLAQQYTGDAEILFIDNASTDGSVDFVRSAFPTVTAIAAKTNLGYAGGNNLGAEHAVGEVFVFLNPDTEVAPNWLAELVHPLSLDPCIGLTTSKILLLDDRTRINACGNEISLSGITWCRGAGQPASMFAEDADVAAVSGCAFAIRADLFRRLGGFDERFFMYLEDTDISWRARAAGYRCRFVANSVVSHDYRLAFSPAKIAQLERNRYLMLGKHLSMRSLFALMPVLALAEVLTWGYAAVRGPACLGAKARATVWAIFLLWPALRSPASPGEGRLLRAHLPAPPVIEGVGAGAARAIQAVVGWLSRGAAVIGLALLPAEQDEGRAQPVTLTDTLSLDSANDAPSGEVHARSSFSERSDVAR